MLGVITNKLRSSVSHFVRKFEDVAEKTTLKKIDIHSNKVMLFNRINGLLTYELSDIVFDTTLIETLSTKDAALIGYL